MFLLTLLLACDPAPDAGPDAHAEHGHGEPAHAEHQGPATPAMAPDAHAHDEAAASQEAPAPHAAPGGLQLALDDGKKWQMDEHTRTVMAEIRSTLDASTGTSKAQAAALSATLGAQLDRLIAGCTMTGPSHDQLHVFLVAFMPKLPALATAADPAAAVDELQGMVATYDQFFE